MPMKATTATTFASQRRRDRLVEHHFSSPCFASLSLVLSVGLIAHLTPPIHKNNIRCEWYNILQHTRRHEKIYQKNKSPCTNDSNVTNGSTHTNCVMVSRVTFQGETLANTRRTELRFHDLDLGMMPRFTTRSAMTTDRSLQAQTLTLCECYANAMRTLC